MKETKLRIWDVQKFHYPEATEEQSNHYLQFGSGGFWLFNEKGRMVTATEVGGECNHFTGFTDKNGKEIYEGDILGDWTKTDEGMKQSRQQVFWNEPTGSWHLDNSSKHDKTSSVELWLELNDYEFEIIGNIYENPELLVSELEVEL